MTQMEQAQILLEEWVQSESLRKHCYAVSASMRHFAELEGADVDTWGAVGLLHDIDYERYPNLEHSSTEGHPFVAVAYLREHGWSEDVCRGILAHADYSGVEPTNALERTIRAVDELSGFVMACALVRPNKSVHEVNVAGVKKKMKDKAFARAVNRDDITRGATELNIPLDELIQHVITALRAVAPQLGLDGQATET